MFFQLTGSNSCLSTTITTKSATLLLSLLIVLNTQAQWSNKTNYFNDSNHMPVSTATGEQVNSLVIRSYPDSGYIVFWEDNRNSATTNTDIYAQKFDKNGKRLWAVNGIPVSNSKNKQHLYPTGSLDFRNYSYAATDSANGFYITYTDDSIAGSATLPRIVVQHISGTGSRVLGATGYIVAKSISINDKYDFPQLIADGNKGYFVGYRRLISSFNGATSDVYVSCYRDESGKMKKYGGGQMDVNAYLQPIGCGTNATLAFRDAYANDYQIYPNLQNGCNVVMSLLEYGAGTENNYIGFNSLIRVKKNTTTKLSSPNNENNRTFTYKKDSVITFYSVYYNTYTYYCGSATGTAYVLESNGFLKVGNYAYQTAGAQGTTLATDGNINAEIITSNIRRYINNTLTNWYTQRFVTRIEKYTDMPYEFKNLPYTPSNLSGTKPGLNTITGNTDTLLSNSSSSSYSYCMKGSGNKIYATALCSKNVGSQYGVLLQQLVLNRKSSTSFALEYTAAGKKGVLTGIDTAGIDYYDPQIAVDNKGNAVFYIKDYATFIRVSPIVNGTQLAWGAMGRAAGSGAYNNSKYDPVAPFMVMDPSNGTSVMSWQDYRNYNGQNGNNIFMRHFDKLLTANYYPPYKPVLTAGKYGSNTIRIDLTGASKHYTLIELFDNFNPSSPAAEILDNTNLGVTRSLYYQNVNAVRKYNGSAYLDRNMNIHTDQTVPAATKVTTRLFFTTADFNVLKAASASVKTPADLMIVQQPATSEFAPQSYSPQGQERNFAVTAWKAVNGGYFVQAAINRFGGINNYFIFPASATTLQGANPFAKAASTNSEGFIKRLYPTPVTNNDLFIEVGNVAVKDMLVEVLTADGKTVLKQRMPYQSQHVDVSNAANGMYWIRITSGNYVYNGSIVKAAN